jgi:ABC-type multidrug transport system permease subunit
MEQNQKNWVQEIGYYIAIIPFAILLLSSFGIVGYQIFNFAKKGIWISVTVADLAEFESLQNNWIGIYKFLTWLPASFTLLVLSIVVLFAIAHLIDEINK